MVAIARVAAVHELQRIAHPRIDPTGPGGRRDDQDRPVPGVGPVELGHHLGGRGVQIAVRDSGPRTPGSGPARRPDRPPNPAAAKSRNSARVGPCATNSRPAAPSDSQLSRESGDPDRSASVGGTSPGSTASLADE